MRRWRVAGLAEVGGERDMRRLRSTDCTLTGSMFLPLRVHQTIVPAALAALAIGRRGPVWLCAQQAAAVGCSARLTDLPSAEPSDIALPLPEDRGAGGPGATLKRLGTTASLLMIVAHPDDEDGALLTYLSRGTGGARARC